MDSVSSITLRGAGRAAAALVLAAVAHGCAPGADDGALTVVLVTLDTTRADHIGTYGHGGARTPRLNALAARGLVFERAYATAPLTLPSHASMLTGTLPMAHGVRDNTGFALSPQGRLVSEVLAERGWHTGAFVGSFVLDARFGLDQGFDTYDGPRPLIGTAKAEEVMRSAEAVTRSAAEWIASLPRGEPAFLWVHYYDPHMPYTPPNRFAGLDPYDGEIAFCDEQLGTLLDALRRAGRAERQALVVTADHGESLGEHGEPTHGIFLYEGAMRVPLIIRAPGQPPARIETPVSVASIAPTLLQLAGLDADAVADALPDAYVRSLLQPALLDAAEPVHGGDAGDTGSPADRGEPVLMEALLPYYAHGWHPLRAMVWQGHKLIEGQRTELYQLGDGDESDDLAATRPDLADRLAGALREQLERNRPLGWDTDAQLDTADRARLAALGYVGVAAAANDLFDADLPDPVLRIGDLALRGEALMLMQQAKMLGNENSASLMMQARAKLLAWKSAGSPSSPQALQLLSDVEIALGNFAAAAALLQEHAERRPSIALTRFNLAVCHYQLGNEERAIREMIKAVALDPAFPEPYRWLMTTERTRGEYGRAAWWYRQLDRHWHGPPAERADLRHAIATLERDAAARGQPVAPPDGMPAAPR